jgi:hypothetical protein
VHSSSRHSLARNLSRRHQRGQQRNRTQPSISASPARALYYLGSIVFPGSSIPGVHGLRDYYRATVGRRASHPTLTLLDSVHLQHDHVSTLYIWLESVVSDIYPAGTPSQAASRARRPRQPPNLMTTSHRHPSTPVQPSRTPQNSS